MATVVVAEKPSVAKDLARLLGAGRRCEGYLEGNGYRVTWALGHLVAFAEPDEYGPDWSARWSFAQLPMIPSRWKLRVLPKTAAQFQVVKGLLNAPDTAAVICATDAGREGELIFRLIAEHARCRRPVRRLWVSSLTDEAIRAGLARLRPAGDFDALAAAARARAQADWLMGMNLTRAYSVHNRVLCTIGRVQTPTLAMICARDEAIEGFVKTPYYELVAHLLTLRQAPFDALWTRCRPAAPAPPAGPGPLPPGSDTRLASRAEAERLQRALAPHRTGTITAVQRQVRQHRPPPLYDLTSLQRDANRRFGFTAATTLDLAQELYESRKLITYPRTESRHIGEDLLPELPGILRALEHPLAPTALARLQAGHRLGRAYVDRTKLTDHHAILPTARTPPPGLAGPARQVYDLVVARFVAVFLPDAQVEETRVMVDIGGETFVARGSRVLEAGWRRAELPRAGHGGTDTGPAAAETEDRTLPPMEQGETVTVDGLEILEKETEPPRPYDDASLLAAMRNAGREIEDDALAAAMKDSGLGTPATRAEIIEKLIRTGYVERRRKQLRATPKGRALIPLVAEPLRSPLLTAAWEQRLKDIEEGRAGADAFYRDICTLVTDLIPQVASGPVMAAAVARATVSAGGRQRRPAGESDPGSAAAPADDNAGPGTGRRKAAGRRRPTAPPRTADGLGPCPLCRQGQVTETARAYGCSRFREGCGLTIWKTIAGHALTLQEVRQLLAGATVGPLADLQSRAGKTFSAWLRLAPTGQVVFSFDPPEATDSQLPAPAPGARRRVAGAAEASVGPVPSTRRRRAARPPPPRSADQAGVADPDPPPAPTAAALERDPIRCPRCGQGHLIQGRRGFGCSRWRSGCGFVIWQQIAGHRLSVDELRELVTNGRLGPLPDLRDADGRPGTLRLSATDGVQVTFDQSDGFSP